VYDKDAPLPDKGVFKLGVPMLAICYGLQVLAQSMGGKVERGQKREFGKGTLTVLDPTCDLFEGLPRDTWSVLMKNADLAMYRAKRQGRNNYQFFTREMNEEVMRRAQMEAELRTALEEGHFSLAYQPQWNLLGGLQLVGMEALIRWHHAERGWISPAEFIPVAEELGLIVPLGNWVIHEACQAGFHLVEQGHDVKVAVNLSLRQFRDPNLLNTVRLALQNSRLEARYLEFEITESMIMDDISRVLEILGALKDLGVTLSIDDFGTGYSSLSYLKQLPVDQLKVDASFVRDIPHDLSDMEIAAAVIAMAHKLGLKVVAEGIETPAQLAFLRDNRCEMGQGYLLARPMSLESVLQLLEVELTD
jgi:EAL domain-containing protein (putative c-di-GMP-specific phosphodiesterase class I)